MARDSPQMSAFYHSTKHERIKNMQNAIKTDMETIQVITFEAYKTSGQVLALLDNSDADENTLGSALDKMAAQG